MKDLLKDFEEFDHKNPRVWDLFVRFTTKAIQRGYKHFGARVVLERIRWEVNIETDGAGFTDDGTFIPLKINNNHTPYYARKFHKSFPEYGEVFSNRRVRCEAAEFPTELF